MELGLVRGRDAPAGSDPLLIGLRVGVRGGEVLAVSGPLSLAVPRERQANFLSPRVADEGPQQLHGGVRNLGCDALARNLRLGGHEPLALEDAVPGSLLLLSQAGHHRKLAEVRVLLVESLLHLILQKLVRNLLTRAGLGLCGGLRLGLRPCLAFDRLHGLPGFLRGHLLPLFGGGSRQRERRLRRG